MRRRVLNLGGADSPLPPNSGAVYRPAGESGRLSGKPLLLHVAVLPVVSVRLVLEGTLASGYIAADRSALAGWWLCGHTPPTWSKGRSTLVVERCFEVSVDHRHSARDTTAE